MYVPCYCRQSTTIISFLSLQYYFFCVFASEKIVQESQDYETAIELCVCGLNENRHTKIHSTHAAVRCYFHTKFIFDYPEFLRVAPSTHCWSWSPEKVWMSESLHISRCWRFENLKILQTARDTEENKNRIS
jgi:hypothetical protein